MKSFLSILVLSATVVIATAAPAAACSFGRNCLQPSGPFGGYRHDGSRETFRHGPFGRPSFGRYRMDGNRGGRLNCRTNPFGPDTCSY